MKTLVTCLSIGERKIAETSVLRLDSWCQAQGYAFKKLDSVIDDSRPGRSLTYQKLLIPVTFPEYDRVVVVDDDILMSAKAPGLPDTGPDQLALALNGTQQHREKIPDVTIYNTGFVIVGKDRARDFADAYEGDDADFGCAPGTDQAEINARIYRGELAITELDPRWNFQVPQEFREANAGASWNRNPRLGRLVFLSSCLTPGNPWRKRIREAWGIHLLGAVRPLSVRVINACVP
jgi:hypothetical protein